MWFMVSANRSISPEIADVALSAFQFSHLIDLFEFILFKPEDFRPRVPMCV